MKISETVRLKLKLQNRLIDSILFCDDNGLNRIPLEDANQCVDEPAFSIVSGNNRGMAPFKFVV